MTTMPVAKIMEAGPTPAFVCLGLKNGLCTLPAIEVLFVLPTESKAVVAKDPLGLRG
jgi:hypothetical protein